MLTELTNHATIPLSTIRKQKIMLDINGVTISKVQENRWNCVVDYISALKKAVINNNAVIWYNDSFINIDLIEVTEFSISVKMGNCYDTIFDKDTTVDHGLFTPINDLKKMLNDRFKLYKEIRFD